MSSGVLTWIGGTRTLDMTYPTGRPNGVRKPDSSVAGPGSRRHIICVYYKVSVVDVVDNVTIDVTIGTSFGLGLSHSLERALACQTYTVYDHLRLFVQQILEHRLATRQRRVVSHANVPAHAVGGTHDFRAACIAEPWVVQVQAACYVERSNCVDLRVGHQAHSG